MSFQGLKVVVVTPAGRRRYLDVLRRYVLTSPIVDRWDLWVNTDDQEDLVWMGEQVGKSEKVRTVHAPLLTRKESASTPHQRKIESVYRFFPRANDADTVYVRLDDDIVYLAPGFFETLLSYRLRCPTPLLVSAAVVNNAIVDHLRQRAGVLGLTWGKIGYRCMDPLGWENPGWAEHVHRRFLEDVRTGYRWRWQTSDWVFYDSERFSINAVSWTGTGMAAAQRIEPVGEDEEWWLTGLYPQNVGIPNHLCGGAICAHFAFHTQREHLDRTDILDGYRQLADDEAPVRSLAALAARSSVLANGEGGAV